MVHSLQFIWIPIELVNFTPDRTVNTVHPNGLGVGKTLSHLGTGDSYLLSFLDVS